MWVRRTLAVLMACAPLAATATKHDFVPRVFHRYYWSAIPPALHISPGDTVRTRALDANGYDQHGKQLALAGKPQTGPFYVEGALPGDTLVIHLDKLQPNRDAVPGSNAILGCLAVAPPGQQSFPADYLGEFGGNLDFAKIGEGATVDLPVFQPGALLFMGDGRAGDAAPTSMDIEFTVDLVKNDATSGPRAENGESLMSWGFGGSEGEAKQAAAAQLAQWLLRDFKLHADETAFQYDVDKLAGARYAAVAKVRKPR